MPEHEQQAERPREEVDEEHPATVIELKAAAEEAAEPAAGERGADADAANGAPARTGGTEPDGASKASLSLTKSADTAAVAPDAPQPQAPESVAGAADGTATDSREQRELWAPPNPAERSPGPAPYGAQPLGAVPGGYAAPPAPYGLGSPYAAAAPLTSPAPASPVPPPPIGPDGPGPAPAGPPARYGQASGPSPYGVYHAGPVPPPYGPSAAQPPLPYGPGYGAGAPGYPAPYAHGWGWPTGLRNGMGDASLALGIIGLVLFLAFPLAMILGVLALIFGGIGHARARRGEAGNRGQALAGMICGGVALVLGALVLALVVSTAGEDADGHVDEGGYSATSVR
ncbi:DUF4190 domain-containing protein [Streptomyces koyangensis]|uniref:DUF4190 domain-containing protein n=1 Tax=Streptomyces koyangensis TaxID=188770 RepID=UPI003C30D251